MICSRTSVFPRKAYVQEEASIDDASDLKDKALPHSPRYLMIVLRMG
jgi:hypothetical protein